MKTVDRPRILTDNERYGSGFLDEDAPGAWCVMTRATGMLNHIFSNRDAAEAYIQDHGRAPDYYSLQVWHISDSWPDD